MAPAAKQTDPLHDFLLGQGGLKSRRGEIITITRDIDGSPVSYDLMVLQPSLADVKAQSAFDKDNFGSVVDMVIRCTVHPHSRARVFNEADREGLLQQPINGWVEQIALKAFELGAPAKQDPKVTSQTA